MSSYAYQSILSYIIYVKYVLADMQDRCYYCFTQILSENEFYFHNNRVNDLAILMKLIIISEHC